MPSDSGRTTSSWMATSSVPVFEPLPRNTRTDVCVIGAGIAGLSTAYELARRGKRVVVVDDNAIGEGESGRTTAHLSYALDEGFDALEKVHGAEGARLAAESHRRAVDRIEEIVRLEGITCEFTRLDGYLFAAKGQDASRLSNELGAAQRAGLEDVSWVDRAPIPGFDSERCLRFPEQGQFHILKYLSGLARAFVEAGGTIHTRTHVRSVEGGKPAKVQTTSGLAIEADAVVVATNSPISDWVAMHTRIYPYRTYAVAGRIPPGSVLTALFWDLGDPYHYVRVQNVESHDGSPYELLIVGGEDHKVGQAEDLEQRFERLRQWTQEHFPVVESWDFAWSGQVIEPVDGLAFIGRDPAGLENVYICTGDSGHGMTHGTLAGQLLTGLIVDGSHPWESLYSPSRKSLRTAGTFLKENLNVARQYADWLRGGDVKSPEEIPPGSGALIREGARKMVAVYRAPNGEYTRRSAVCSHLGCIVQWNDLEKSWDCPCHGSRFGPDGHVLNGPALKGLAPAE